MIRSLPTRRLPERPDLDQLRRQAKELLERFRAGDRAEADAHFRDADTTFALHDAQLVIARAYGFESWPKLKAHVDGVTVRRLIAAIRSGDHEQARSMLKVRPELGRMSSDNLQVLHYAVLQRSPEMVRLLMQHDANAREGVYPHRDATSPLTIALERGYHEIVDIIKEEEQQRRGGPSLQDIIAALAEGNTTLALRLLETTPELLQIREPWTALHAASRSLNHEVTTWLLDRGADPNAKGWHGMTPLDIAAVHCTAGYRDMAALLLSRGAEMTPRAAVALGDGEWLRGRHAAGRLENPIEDSGGLLRIAVSHDGPDVLALLLDLGFDPNERTRVGDGDEVEFSAGMPL